LGKVAQRSAARPPANPGPDRAAEGNTAMAAFRLGVLATRALIFVC
jgi:hypothetical protein